MPFPVFLKGADGRYRACNKLFLEFSGLAEDQVIGRTATDLAPPDLAALYAKFDAAVWSEEGPQIYECAAPVADGTTREVRFHKSLLRDDAGSALGILGVVYDITEKKRAIRALAESESRFARLAELAREGVVLHAEGIIVDANDAFCRMTGWSRPDVLGRRCDEVIGADEADGTRRIVMRRNDGSTFAAEVQSRTAAYGGEAIRVLTIEDVTGRLEAEQAMRERELLYRQMFETNVAVKLVVDPATGQIVDANAAAERFYGWPLDQLRRMHITDINTLPAEEVQAEMARAQVEDRLFFRFPHRTASGEIKAVEVYSGPVTFHGRSLLHSIIFDVTERERARAELERKTEALELSNADLQQFAFVASHDLQEPLRTVVSYLQLLERRYKGNLDADADEFIGYAVQAAKRMGQLIRDLLTYSRVDSQGGELERVESATVVDAALANLRSLLDAAGATVHVGTMPAVLGDPIQLASVFQNLIANAVKYRHRERPPVIQVTAEPEGDGQVVFTVADNGIGIGAEYLDRIFKIFQRLHAQSEYPGTGIGLALVRRIVTRHGGRIWAESAEGEGAKFRFTLRAA